MKIQKWQNGKKNFWVKLARQLQTAPSNGETTLANTNAIRNVIIEKAREDAVDPNRAEEDIMSRTGAVAAAFPLALGIAGAGTAVAANPALYGKAAFETAASMTGGAGVDTASEALTGKTFGENVAHYTGADKAYQNNALTRFGFDMLNPGYALGGGAGKTILGRIYPTVFNPNVGKLVGPPSKESYSSPTATIRNNAPEPTRPITVAEAQGRPKDMRFNYNLSEAYYKKVLSDANDFALKYGYPEIKDTPDALNQIQNMYRRHNTFGRTISDPDEFNPVWHHFGQEHRGLTTEQRAKIAATEGYPYAFGGKNPTDRVFVTGSPEVLEGYSAAEQPTFAVRRSISLGHNPLKWRQNAEFTLGDWSKEMKPNEVRATSTNQGGSHELFLGTGNLSAEPLTSPTQLSGAFNEPVNDFQIGWLQQQGFGLPRKHLQGEDAVQMFKEYGSVQIPENSKIIEQLRKYVPEARERYGLVGNTNITDDEIAGSLYKKALELGGDTAAVNEVGEPLVLFRGDTKRYLALKPRMSPEELATKRGTMDNSLGTLFLDFPNTYQGVDRYLGTIRNFNGDWEYLNSGTGSKVIGGSREFDPTSGFPKGTYKLYSGLYGKKQTPISVWKLPGSQMESGINDLNGFVVRTKFVRDATPEISVLNDDWLAKGAVGSKPHMKTILIEDENGFPLFKHPDGSVTEALAGMDNRPGMAEHYRFVLDDAKSKEQGLLWSRSEAPLRDEHTDYNYYALPNFNILGAKHLLPYDFRVKPRWGSKLIYRKQGGILKAQNGTFESFWNTLPSNQKDSSDFNVRRYWELNGKPQTFEEAVAKGMYSLEKDNLWHAGSIAYNEDTGEYEFMKSPNHPTVQYEIDAYNSDDMKGFRKSFYLDSTSIPWKYKPRKEQGGILKVQEGQTTPELNFMDRILKPIKDFAEQRRAEKPKDTLNTQSQISETPKFPNNQRARFGAPPGPHFTALMGHKPHSIEDGGKI